MFSTESLYLVFERTLCIFWCVLNHSFNLYVPLFHKRGYVGTDYIKGYIIITFSKTFFKCCMWMLSWYFIECYLLCFYVVLHRVHSVFPIFYFRETWTHNGRQFSQNILVSVTADLTRGGQGLQATSLKPYFFVFGILISFFFLRVQVTIGSHFLK